MKKEFNYQASLNLIKASLFDIYENQEEIIGGITNIPSREKHLGDFINLKNLALMLIEGIEYLYEEQNNTAEIKTLEKVELNNDELLKKYYLKCDEDKLNFAYIPTNLLLKLKHYHNSLNESSDIEVNRYIEKSDEEEQGISYKQENKFYKHDNKKEKGIIVRSDQYMKLALSRNRQEVILKDAREYRKEEAIKKRREEQQKKLKEAEVKLNI